jgi:hypothetical protein
MNADVIVSKILLKITEISIFVSTIKLKFFLFIIFYRRIIQLPAYQIKYTINWTNKHRKAQLTDYP